MRLFFAIIGSEAASPAPVSVDASVSVADLTKAIVAEICCPFPALYIKLYLAKLDNGAWLQENDQAFKELRQPDFPRDSPYLTTDPLRSAWLVDDYFPANTPKHKVIHVLVLLPKVQTTATGSLIVGETRSIAQVEGTILQPPHSLKKPALAIDWVLASKVCPQLRYNDSRFLRIPGHYHEKSGVNYMRPVKDLWLYRRGAVEEQWNEITRDSVQSAAVLWIYGAPGAGKSCAAYAFACGIVDRARWNVLWIHQRPAHRGHGFLCVKFEGDVKWTCEFQSPGDVDSLLASSCAASSCELEAKSSEDVERLLGSSCVAPSCSAERGLFVFLDGYRSEGISHDCQRLQDKLIRWQENNQCHRRLVCVTSMTAIGKELNDAECGKLPTPPTPLPSRQNGRQTMRDSMFFQLSSWQLEEYQEAVKDDAFFRSVMVAFGVEEVLDIARRQKLVEEKHYVSGGSARAMFTYTMEDAKKALKKAVAAVNNAEVYARALAGGSSQGVINRLLAHYDYCGSDIFTTKTVSTFASRLVALQLGPKAIIDFASNIRVNAAMDGHLFEEWVLASLRFHKLQYRERNEPEKTLYLKACGVDVFDPTWDVITRRTIITDVLSGVEGISEHLDQCFVPIKWNQAGYDAIYIGSDEQDSSRLRYIFLQVTRATTHKYDAEPFRDVLNLLDEHEVNVGNVELWFMVPLSILTQFKSKVTDLEWSDVVQTAFRGHRRSAPSVDVKSSVHVVGVSYPLLESTDRRLQ